MIVGTVTLSAMLQARNRNRTVGIDSNFDLGPYGSVLNAYRELIHVKAVLNPDGTPVLDEMGQPKFERFRCPMDIKDDGVVTRVLAQVRDTPITLPKEMSGMPTDITLPVGAIFLLAELATDYFKAEDDRLAAEAAARKAAAEAALAAEEAREHSSSSSIG